VVAVIVSVMIVPSVIVLSVVMAVMIVPRA